MNILKSKVLNKTPCIKCDIALPDITQNELNEDTKANGYICVSENNMYTYRKPDAN